MLNYYPKFRGDVDPYLIAPSKVFPGDIWQDTSGDVSLLKKRNNDNDDWLSFRRSALNSPLILASVAIVALSNLNVDSAPAQIASLTPDINASILLIGQADSAENGVYVYLGENEPMIRRGDFDGRAMPAGTLIWAQNVQ